MSSAENQEKITEFMKSPSETESIVFDPATGKLMVQSKAEFQLKQQRGSDKKVMLDMNRPGAGGFFWIEIHHYK